MATKIEYDKVTPLQSIFNDYTFMTNDAAINSGETAGVINIMTFEDGGNAGFENDLPTFSYKIKVRFVNNDSPEINQQIVNTLGTNFSYHKTKLRYVQEVVPDEDENTKRTLFNKSHSYYNFQLPLYEEMSRNAEESSLPCYMFGSYHKQFESGYTAGLLQKQDPQLQGISEAAFVGKYPTHTNNNMRLFDFHSSYDFQKSYYTAFLELGAESVNADFNTMAMNLFVSEISSVQPKESELYHLPFYNFVKIPRSPSHSNSIREAIKSTSLIDIIMKHAHLKIQSEDLSSIEGNPLIEMLDLLDPDIPDEVRRRMRFNESDGIGISLYDPAHIDIQDDGQFDDFEYFSNIESIKLRLIDFIKSNRIEPKQVANGIDCYNEAIFYRVVKTRGGRATPVQTFYMFNAGNQKLSFIDTQVRYGTEYTYTFYPYYFVLGFDYEVVNTSYTESAQPHFEMEYRAIPSLKMIEANSGEFVTRIVEPPPRKPIIKFSNYKNKDNKIKLTVEDRTGTVIEDRYREELVTLSESDNQYKEHLSQYCGSLYPYYSNVASYGVFEVYRLEEMPETIRDFDGNLVQIISNNVADRYSRKRIKKTSTMHYLEHGKKYYYLFRARTHQDNFSNPSPVYEVEKIKDSDETILRVKTIKISTIEPVSYDTSFRKFLKLSYPEYHITGKSVTPSGDADTAIGPDVSLKLGDDDLPDNLWKYNSLSGSHIKLRLESKSTGKKIDFNLIFNYNQPENN